MLNRAKIINPQNKQIIWNSQAVIILFKTVQGFQIMKKHLFSKKEKDLMTKIYNKSRIINILYN
jgi:hypothetical protein